MFKKMQIKIHESKENLQKNINKKQIIKINSINIVENSDTKIINKLNNIEMPDIYITDYIFEEKDFNDEQILVLGDYNKENKKYYNNIKTQLLGKNIGKYEFDDEEAKKRGYKNYKDYRIKRILEEW